MIRGSALNSRLFKLLRICRHSRWPTCGPSGVLPHLRTMRLRAAQVRALRGRTAGKRRYKVENIVDPTQRADNSFIYDTTIESLFAETSLYDGRMVQVVGEVIGDRIARRRKRKTLLGNRRIYGGWQRCQHFGLHDCRASSSNRSFRALWRHRHDTSRCAATITRPAPNTRVHPTFTPPIRRHRTRSRPSRRVRATSSSGFSWPLPWAPWLLVFFVRERMR